MENREMERERNEVEEMMKMRKEKEMREREEGIVEEVKEEEIWKGEIVVMRKGERVKEERIVFEGEG